MANFSNSILTAAIYQASLDFQGVENRDSEFGGVKAFLSNKSEMQRVARLATASQKPSSFRMNTFAPSPGLGALTCNPTSASGDSADTALTWGLVTGEVQIASARSGENQYTTEEQLVIDLKNMWSGIADELEVAAMAYLNTNRSQADINQGESTWNGSTAYYNSIALANKDYIRGIINSEMRAAKYNQRKSLIHTAPYDNFFDNTDLQGGGNARNLQDQDRRFDYFYTNEASAVASTYGGIFVVPMGGIQMLTWVRPTYRTNKPTGSEEWGMQVDPLLGLNFGMFKSIGCADTTAVGGDKQDRSENVQFHLNYAFTHAPITSPSGETPIHKYALATS